MKMNKRKGLSLVELVVAMGLLVFLMASAFMVVRRLFVSSNAASLASQADEKLRTISTQIRFLAAAQFNTMTETHVDRTGPENREIKVDSTIHPIDPASRTRKVELVATYFISPGNPTTKTLTFNVGQIQANLSGGAVKACVVAQGSLAPVPGVTLQAPGEDLVLVSGLTGTDGCALVYGVKLGSAAMNAQLNATIAPPAPVYAYFPVIPNTQVLNLPANHVLQGELRDLGTHQIVMPGSASGKIRDIVTTNGVDNYQVRFYPRLNQVPPGYNLLPPPGYISATTDVNGDYVIGAAMVGTYYVALVGQAPGGSPHVYCSTDRPDTYSVDNQRIPTVIITSGNNTGAVDRDTAQKADAQVYLREATPSGPVPTQVNFGSDLPAGVRLQLSIDQRYTFKSNILPVIQSTYNMSNSYAGYILGANWVYPANLTDSSGVVTFSDVAPLIIHNDNVNHPYLNQYAKASIQPGEYKYNGIYASVTPVPYAPVAYRLVNDLPSTPQVLYYRGSWGSSAMIGPNGTNGTVFDLNLYTDGLSNANNTTSVNKFGLLLVSNSVMACASGVVTAVPPMPSDTLWAYHEMATNWGNFSGNTPGQGALVYSNAFNSYYIRNDYKTDTIVNGDGSQSYSFSNPMGATGVSYRIFPNLASDKQVFSYSALRSTYTILPETFDLYCKAYKKNASGLVVNILPFNTGNTFEFTIKYYNGGGIYLTENPVQTNQGISLSSATFSHNARYTVSYSTRTPPYTYAPGELKIFNIVANSTNSYVDYYVTPTTETTSTYWFIQNAQYLNGIVVTWNPALSKFVNAFSNAPFEFGTRVFKHFQGTVKNTAGQVVGGANVSFVVNGIAAPFNVTTDAFGVYHLPDPNPANKIGVVYYPTAIDMVGTVSAGGYNTSYNNYVTVPDDGIDPQIISDIILTPAGGGGGGGSGGSG